MVPKFERGPEDIQMNQYTIISETTWFIIRNEITSSLKPEIHFLTVNILYGKGKNGQKGHKYYS